MRTKVVLVFGMVALAAASAAHATTADELIAKRHASVPMGFMGDAWDIANTVVFLASDEARYITATQIVVDGGLTAAR